MTTGPAAQGSTLGLSGHRVSVRYLLQAHGASAVRMAQLICIDQTVEAVDAVIPEGAIRDDLIGRIEAIEANESIELINPSESIDSSDCSEAGQSIATISYPIEWLGQTAAETLHLLFGTSSLKPGIRLIGLDLPPEAPLPFRGARFGASGLRTLLAQPTRPLVVGVLKPAGLPIAKLAALARELALGGVDWIKDDQGMTDQPFCPFEERVRACVEAIEQANRETGFQTRYVAHVTGASQDLQARARFAQQAGAGGLLICPGLCGYDSLHQIASDDQIGLPIFSHPAFLGTYAHNPVQGIAPAVLYGTIPRLFGADVSLYPTWGTEFGMTRTDCRRIAQACLTSSTGLALPPIFPSAAGRIGIEQIDSMHTLYGRDVVYILGSRLQHAPEGLRQACRTILSQLTSLSGQSGLSSTS